jgi:rhodanese-related sulfurtransferase
MTMTELITRSDLEMLVAAGSVVLIDALPASYYDQLHLPSALNLVESDVNNEAPRLLPDKKAAIVTYCSNEACGNSQAVANRLERLGYTAVRKYREGIQDWVAAGNPTESSTSAA